MLRQTSTWIHLCFLNQLALASLPSELWSPLVPQKILATAQSLPVEIQYPQYTYPSNGSWELFPTDTWTSGFFPATMYALNQRSLLCNASSSNGLDADWLTWGRNTSSALIQLESNNTLGHDVGFISYPYILELQVNPSNDTAKDAVNKFAADLANRFSPVVGCTRSWDNTDPNADDFVVIIDNMMNLAVLFASANLTSNSTLRDIATSHADTTIKNHIRDDGSTWHVVDYNSTDGSVISKYTAQGYADNSTWSRGQSFGVYGFASMYNYTGNITYLETSRQLASNFISQMPSSGIVPWDFDAPPESNGVVPADSAAATVVTNGLLMLSQLETNATLASQWQEAALEILTNITNLAWMPDWQSLLANGTVDLPSGNYLTGIVYADYFFVQAGNMLIDMGLATDSGCLSSSTSSNSSNGSSSSSSSSSNSSNAPSKSHEYSCSFALVALSWAALYSFL